MESSAAIELSTVQSQRAHGRRVLVAEDNRLTSELLKLMLNQRGHHVDTARDGQQALLLLRENDYDVAFLDYDLPRLSGSQVAATIRRESSGRKVPRMIAITADLKELLAQSEGAENLDQLLPLDIDDVETKEKQPTESLDERQEDTIVPLRPAMAAKLVSQEHRSAFENLGYNFLTWPGDIETGRLSARAMRASLGDPQFDGILVREPTSVEKLATLWKEPSLYTLPIIDLTGELGPVADFDGSQLAAIESGELDQMVCAYRNRRALLHRDILLSSELSDMLIGRTFVTGQPIVPHYDPGSTWSVSYNVALPVSAVVPNLETLWQTGLLRRDFFERFHTCPSCNSHRLHVREECAECKSSDLSEGQYIHHFACAYLGPEDDFRQGDSLVCPKCSQELTHFGFDYDRPGSMVTCNSCGHTSSEPSVGFVCLDCNSHVDGEAAATRDLFAYTLTNEGVAFAKHGRSAMGPGNQALRLADVPLELVVALNRSLSGYQQTQMPFVLAELSYLEESAIAQQEGPRAFAMARNLFIENLRARLGDQGLAVKAQSRDYVLFFGVTADAASAGIGTVLSQAQSTLRWPLGVVSQIFGPEAFA